MSSCEHGRRLSAYYDGELSGRQQQVLEAHLKECASCRQQLRELRSLSRLLSGARVPALGSAAAARLHKRIPSVREQTVVRMAEVLAVAAAVLLVVSLSWLLQTVLKKEPPAGPGAAPEILALTMQTDRFTDADAEFEFAQWIVEDLSREDGND